MRDRLQLKLQPQLPWWQHHPNNISNTQWVTKGMMARMYNWPYFYYKGSNSKYWNSVYLYVKGDNMPAEWKVRGWETEMHVSSWRKHRAHINKTQWWFLDLHLKFQLSPNTCSMQICANTHTYTRQRLKQIQIQKKTRLTYNHTVTHVTFSASSVTQTNSNLNVCSFHFFCV